MSAIYSLLEHRRVTGDVSDCQQSGRPRVTSVCQDRIVRPTHLQKQISVGSCYLKTNKRSQQPTEKS